MFFHKKIHFFVQKLILPSTYYTFLIKVSCPLPKGTRASIKYLQKHCSISLFNLASFGLFSRPRPSGGGAANYQTNSCSEGAAQHSKALSEMKLEHPEKKADAMCYFEMLLHKIKNDIFQKACFYKSQNMFQIEGFGRNPYLLLDFPSDVHYWQNNH